MDDAPKSAVELAMARFKKQDADEGVTDRVLTDDQKNEIAEVRKTYGAKLAQEEILFKSSAQALDPWLCDRRFVEVHPSKLAKIGESLN